MDEEMWLGSLLTEGTTYTEMLRGKESDLSGEPDGPKGREQRGSDAKGVEVGGAEATPRS